MASHRVVSAASISCPSRLPTVAALKLPATWRRPSTSMLATTASSPPRVPASRAPVAAALPFAGSLLSSLTLPGHFFRCKSPQQLLMEVDWTVLPIVLDLAACWTVLPRIFNESSLNTINIVVRFRGAIAIPQTTALLGIKHNSQPVGSANVSV